jgi:hypothetical protein
MVDNIAPKVFISYAREDYEVAEYLFNALKKKGINVWKDNKSLRIGEPFREVIDQAIRTSDFAIVCLSSASINKIGFVQREFRQILETSKYRPISVPFALPIKLDHCEPPMDFAEYHWKELPSNRGAFVDELANEIIEHYKEIAKRKGLAKNESASDIVQEIFQATHDVICHVLEDPEPIVLRTKIQMALQDINKYQSADSPHLGAWSAVTLERIVQELLFDKKYIDLLLGCQALESEIKKRLAAEAKTIGYEIKQTFAVPKLEPFKWLEVFTIETGGDFEIRSSTVSVRLRILVTAEIKALQDIEPYLIRRVNVPRLMEELSIEEARQCLHNIDPERFYMRFKYSDSEHEIPLETELINRISKVLSQSFNAEITSIVLKIEDDTIISRFRVLQERICAFQVEVLSLHGGDTIRFKGDFRVEAIDSNGWHMFSLREYTLEEITAYVEETIRAIFGTLPIQTLQYKDISQLEEIRRVVNTVVRTSVIERFGLVIKVNNFHRERTKSEMMTNELNDLTRSEISQWRLELLRKLLKQRSELIALGETTEELKELDERIEKLRKEILSDE